MCCTRSKINLWRATLVQQLLTPLIRSAMPCGPFLDLASTLMNVELFGRFNKELHV